jgi:diguanylate cyclase (GGDEF)-like protein
MESPVLRDEVQRLLSAGARLVFSPTLASAYEARLGHSRKRHLAMALGLTALAVLVAALLDHLNMPAQFARSLDLRASVVVLCVAGAVAVLRVRPGIWEAAAFGVPLTAQVALSAWMASAAAQNMVDRNIVMSLMLFAVLCAVPPLPVAASRVLAAIWYCCFVVTLWAAEGTQHMSRNVMALLVGAVALAVGVGLASRRETARRREFLQALNAELTSEELRHANAELERLMNTDVLTGVANRRRFESDMRAVWQSLPAKSDGCGSVGLILADVDHFKSFNDCAGHAAGDSCLRSIATTIAQVVQGETAGVARWGGEEFVVLAPGASLEGIAGLAERIRTAVERLTIPHPAFFGRSVTVSVGAAWCGPGMACETPDDLLRTADDALYSAKSAGRNQVVSAGTLARRVAAE